MTRALLFLALATAAGAQTGWWKRHLGDTAMHAAATSADIATSYGRVELNPMYRSPNGTFGGGGVGVHIAQLAAIETTKWLILRNPERRNSRLVRWMSRGPALSLGVTAIRNGVVR